MAKLTGNPTRTRVIERNWLREIRRRWTAFTRSVLPALDAANERALLVNAPADPFVMSPEQQRTYMAFFEQEIDRLLLETEDAPNWQGQYQLEAYMRGLTQMRARLRSQGQALEPTPEERLAAAGLAEFTAQPTLATTPRTLQPIHRGALEFLFQRSYDTLEGWTSALTRETRQILFDAVEQGQGIREVTREIRDRIGVSRSRAERVARTETNQAYSRSSISEVERVNLETGPDVEDVMVRWITAIVPTARGNPVRPNHAKRHGVVMTPEAAAAVKRDDGVNCRCALAPVVPGTNTPERQAFFDAQREQTMSITEAIAA